MGKETIRIDKLFKFCLDNKIDKVPVGHTKAVFDGEATISTVEAIDNNHRGMTKVKVKVFHTGKNEKGFSINKEDAEREMYTIKNRPLLANIYQRPNGDWEFGSHDIKFEKTDDGELEIVEYIEREIGSFSEADPWLEYDEERNIYFVCAYAYISNEYTKAVQVLLSKGGHCRFSVEINVEEMGIDLENNCMSVNKFFISGGTLLGIYDGTDIEVHEGMKGACVDIIAFSLDKLDLKDYLHNDGSNLINTPDTQERCDDKSQDTGKKGGNKMEDNKIIKNSETNLDKLELDNAEPIANEDDNAESNVDDGDTNTIASTDDNSSDENGNGDNTGAGDGSSEGSEGSVQTYSLDMKQISSKIESLIEASFDDGSYVDITAMYNDRVVYQKNWDGNYLSVGYSVSGTDVSISNDVHEVYPEFLTKEEHEQLTGMRAAFAEMKDKLAKFEAAEAETKKKEILCDAKYSSFLDKEEFSALKANASNYSLDEFKSASDKAFMDCVMKYGYTPKSLTRNDTLRFDDMPISGKRFVRSDKAFDELTKNSGVGREDAKSAFSGLDFYN